MERRNSTKWINQLKIAIINNDLDKLVEYSKRDIPSFSSIKDAKEALHLLQKAKNIISIKKNEIGMELNKLKESQKYRLENNENCFNDWKA